MEILKIKNRLAATGRNDPCPCGSGHKYKKCCLAADETRVREALREPPALVAEERKPPVDDIDSKLEVFEGEADDLPAVFPTNPALDAAWDAFNAIEHPTTAQMDVYLDRVLALPTDETNWNDLFHLFARKGHEDLPAVFRRIEAGVRPTKESALAFFHWTALEHFVTHGRRELVPGVLAGMRRLDGETYDADALHHMELWALAAGCDGETLTLVEHFLPILRADRELMPHAVPESARMVFHLRLGMALRAARGVETEHAVLAKKLMRGISQDITREYAELAAAAILNPGSQPEPTRQDFIFPTRDQTVDESAMQRRFLALQAVARAGWEEAGRPPGIAIHGLWMLVDAAFEERRDWPAQRRRDPIDLIACLHPSGLERRIATASRDMLGTNRPHAHLLIEAHADLLRFASRRGLVAQHEAAKSERRIAELREEIGL